MTCIFIYGQNVKIKGHFSYTDGFEQLRFFSFKDSLTVVSKSALKEGNFDLDLKNIKTGIYRLQYGPDTKNHMIDVIITPNDTAISIEMDLREGYRKPRFKGTLINEQLYSYLNKYNVALQQLRFHYQTYHAAPNKNQKEALTSKKEFAKIHSSLLNERSQFIHNNNNNLVGLYVQSLPWFIPSITTLPENIYTDYYAKYWDDLYLHNPLLENTPFFHTYLSEYLGFYASQRLDSAAWEIQMKQVVDTLMQYMNKTSYTQRLALNYLVDGFKAIGHESLLQYVDENYAQTAQCLDDKLQEDVAYRLKSYEIGKLGQEIPNVFLTDTQDLYNSIKGKILLFFWSSTCPHCLKEWTNIQQWSAKNPDFQIIAISLDTNQKDYEDAISKLPKNVHYYCDFKGWDSAAIKSYYIMATPTFFEVDENKKFIKKRRVLD